MIAFICPGLRPKLSVKDEFAGKTGAARTASSGCRSPHAAAAAEALHPWGTPGTCAGAPQRPAENGWTSWRRRRGRANSAGWVGYRVLKVLGSGGMGLVLLAEDPLLKRSVALKVMRPELAAQADARQRFLREAQATAAIEHPHIVHLYQVGEDRGVPFIAMPFLKGEPLDDRLKREKKLPVAEVIDLGRQIAEGLAAAHKHGLIHRDIKPANIWLEPTRRRTTPSWVKILDFGLARAVADDDGQLTKTGAIMGTPAYMAPEQARGEKVDGRCDLFSLGACSTACSPAKCPFKGSRHHLPAHGAGLPRSRGRCRTSSRMRRRPWPI